jgi:hypothetical protein
VVVAWKQWHEVKNSLEAHADDQLRIDGHLVVTKDGTHVLLAQSYVSLRQQREKKRVQSQAETAA